jgi:hypothetical protein
LAHRSPDPVNVSYLPPAPIRWTSNVMALCNELSTASRELAARGALFRVKPPKAPLVPGVHSGITMF